MKKTPPGMSRSSGSPLSAAVQLLVLEVVSWGLVSTRTAAESPCSCAKCQRADEEGGEELGLSHGEGNLTETTSWHPQARLSRNVFFTGSAS